MEVTAKLNRLRVSPRKTRLVTDMVKGLDVNEALAQLNFMNKGASSYISKLLNSAISNAENNFKLQKDNLFIKEIVVNEGQTLKRWKPRAFGRATPLMKRSSRVTIVLAEKKETKKKTDKTKTTPTAKEKKEEKKTNIKVVSPEEIKKLEKKKEHQDGKQEQKKPQSRLGSLRERFLKRTTEK